MFRQYKKCSLSLVAMAAVAFMAFGGSANSATLKDKTILYSPGSELAGQVIPLGVDSYGYNYQAHTFSGSYFNAYANGAGFAVYNGDGHDATYDATYVAANPGADAYWAWPYRGDQLAMKWNDAWLSNADLDNDGKLDRHYGFPTYIGSGAWINNHQSGDYTDTEGEQSWNYFVKIVAAPSDAYQIAGVWYEASGTEIGPVIWGEFAETQGVYNDSGTGDHGVYYHSPAGPGVGKY